MATVIPALSTCVSRMTQGERRTAERLEQKLDEDYLVWYDVPVGPKHAHPDFVVLHPRRGLLILEVKDWRLETIRSATKQPWELLVQGVLKSVPNPIEQARHYAHQVVDALSKDDRLTNSERKLAFPWSYGVVLTHITRKQFEGAELNLAIEPHRVICSDEMVATVEPEDFQSRLWAMFPTLLRGVLSLPQIDRVRWILFPEVRVNTQIGLFSAQDSAGEMLPDIMRAMDLQQEQLARSMGEGHRVIHGVAGSGKTMILSYRAEYLAKTCASAKPILVLCYNQPLAVKLDALMTAKGLAAKVHVRNLHKWCRQQLVAYGQALPAQSPDMFDHMVSGVIRGVDRGQIPSGQYQAVLIDEGHDFEAAWLKLATQMVDPATNSLLVLYDDAQSIYQRRRALKFTFKSVGIHAQGRRTTILRINYRNTRQILQLASMVAAGLLKSEDSADDGVPLVHPVSCGREGHPPVVIQLPSLRDEAIKIAELLSAAHQEGYAWGDMAIICRHYAEMERCAAVLRHRQLPHEVRKGSGTFNPLADTIKLLTMHVSKGLEFPVVAISGMGQMPADGVDEADEARLFYVAATRATQRLFIPLSGESKFATRLIGATV